MTLQKAGPFGLPKHPRPTAIETPRLTQNEHSVLCAITDWKAPYEVVAALYPSGATKRQHRTVRDTLTTLRDKYLASYSAMQGTYKITAAGRARLTQ